LNAPLTKAEVTQAKQAKRAAKESALAAKQLALPDKRYGCIVADPPWRWEPYSRETGMDRAADNHYVTAGTEEIAVLPVADIAAPDCVLWLWAISSMLPDALYVMQRWGFAYKTGLVWVKDRIGLGYWARAKHEHPLIGTRGHIPAPAPGTQWASVIEAPARGHSIKPDSALEMIEGYFPNLPKIELHRRGPARPGWDAWGAEAEE
jgi:N6-adenosine-specific RNA methylase IME4